jgi:hypothetical protein
VSIFSGDKKPLVFATIGQQQLSKYFCSVLCFGLIIDFFFFLKKKIEEMKEEIQKKKNVIKQISRR